MRKIKTGIITLGLALLCACQTAQTTTTRNASEPKSNNTQAHPSPSLDFIAGFEKGVKWGSISFARFPDHGTNVNQLIVDAKILYYRFEVETNWLSDWLQTGEPRLQMNPEAPVSAPPPSHPPMQAARVQKPVTNNVAPPVWGPSTNVPLGNSNVLSSTNAPAIVEPLKKDQ